MEMQLRSHFGARRAPDWVAAVVAGFAASAVADGARARLGRFGRRNRRLGNDAHGGRHHHGPGRAAVHRIQRGRSATMALLTHYILGIFSGLAVSLLIAAIDGERSPGTMQAIGAGFGALIYVINFHVLTVAFPWFVELRGWSTFVGHLVFGMALTFFYWKLAHPAPVAPTLTTRRRAAVTGLRPFSS